MRSNYLFYLLAFFVGIVSSNDEWYSVFSEPTIANPQSYQHSILYPTRWGDGYRFQLADQSLYETVRFHYDRDANNMFVNINGLKYYLQTDDWFLSANLQPPTENGYNIIVASDGETKITQIPLQNPVRFVRSTIDGSGTYLVLHHDGDTVNDDASIFTLVARSNATTPQTEPTPVPTSTSESPTTPTTSSTAPTTTSESSEAPDTTSSTSESSSAGTASEAPTTSSTSIPFDSSSQAAALSSSESLKSSQDSEYSATTLLGSYTPSFDTTTSPAPATSPAETTTTSHSSATDVVSVSSGSSPDTTSDVPVISKNDAHIDKGLASIFSVVFGFFISLIV